MNNGRPIQLAMIFFVFMLDKQVLKILETLLCINTCVRKTVISWGFFFFEIGDLLSESKYLPWMTSTLFEWKFGTLKVLMFTKQTRHKQENIMIKGLYLSSHICYLFKPKFVKLYIRFPIQGYMYFSFDDIDDLHYSFGVSHRCNSSHRFLLFYYSLYWKLFHFQSMKNYFTMHHCVLFHIYCMDFKMTSTFIHFEPLQIKKALNWFLGMWFHWANST